MRRNSFSCQNGRDDQSNDPRNRVEMFDSHKSLQCTILYARRKRSAIERTSTDCTIICMLMVIIWYNTVPTSELLEEERGGIFLLKKLLNVLLGTENVELSLDYQNFELHLRSILPE